MRVACLALMSLGFGALLSCRQATQITVKLRGEGFACKASAGEPGYAAAGVLARPQLTGAGDLPGPRADGRDDDCSGNDPVELGSVVLVPQSGVGPVEVLAIAALSPTSGPAPSVDDCLGVYEAFLDDGVATCAPTDPCAACIFARRSLGFVEYSNLDLTITLDNDCAGVLCEASKTCVPERGCVSAVVECDGSTCDDPVGAGGSGAGGGGGGDGGSGGGSTGGAPPGTWEQLPITGGEPTDVVARVESTSGENVLATYVAAGDRLVRYLDRAPLDEIVGAAPDTYVAVASEEQGTRVVSVGSLGVGIKPDFTPEGMQYSGFVDLDVAFANSAASPIVAVDRGPGVTCSAGSFGSAFAECGVALFASGVDPNAEVFVAMAGGYGAVLSGSTPVNLNVSAPEADWSLWAHPVSAGASGEKNHAYQVAEETMIRRFWVDAGGALGHEDLPNLASGTLTGAKIDAIWGAERANGIDLFAVGELDGKGWLGRAEIYDGTPSFNGWFTLPVPLGTRTLRSVWVGPDPQLDDAPVIVVVGSKINGDPMVAIRELANQ